jgi:hypothetical protein
MRPASAFRPSLRTEQADAACSPGTLLVMVACMAGWRDGGAAPSSPFAIQWSPEETDAVAPKKQRAARSATRVQAS